MRLPTALALLVAAPAALASPGPLNEAVPLAPAPAAASAGDSSFDLVSADRALSLGFPSAAATIYRSLLRQPGSDAGRLTLDLASALLDDGDVAGAARALESYPGSRGAAWHLRQGLVDAHQQRTDQARSELAETRAEDLEGYEKGWYHFLEGMLADAANEPVRAATFYQQAVSSATSDLQRARFVLAEEQLRLRLGKVTQEQISNDRKNAEKFQGQKIGYGFAREYAIALNASGQRQQAVDALQSALRALPQEERAEVDHVRLLIGLVAGAGAGVGRQELFELLSSGSDPDLQRAALQLLDRESPPGPRRTELGERLDRLIDAPRPHPILESLLVCRAELALGEARSGLGDSAALYAKAEDSANALLQRFPGSPLKAHAYAVLAGSAWEQQRYRTAADYGTKAAAVLPAGQVRSSFGVLVAEAWYRAGVQGRDRSDFRSAADAYAVALRSRPSGTPAGVLMFQEVQSQIEAGDLRGAESELDELSRDRSFDSDDRWEAEWNLARSLEVQGGTDAAYARVNRLLEAAPQHGLRPELRARMAWLQARLSFDAHKPRETLRLVDALSSSVGGLPEQLGTDIMSTSDLLRAQAHFALHQESDAEDTLGRLRRTYPTTDAAVYSYIVEAGWAAQQDKVIDAERLLTKLADSFPSSRYAPYALYQAALQAERLGTDENLRDSDKFLEDLVTKYPESDLVFAARMRQGDILRELNQFPQAQQAYESLVNSPTAYLHPENTVLAQLALAECHNAQSADSPSHEEAARRIFEDLVDRVVDGRGVSADVKAEAGYNLGVIIARKSPEKAEAVWWNDVVDPLLLRPGGAAELRSQGRWWLARTLLDVGALYERQGKLEEARRAWTLLIDSGLPGGSLARQRLARFNLPAPRA
ncbi:MAG TPA: tetratricopeptide repeat protein [Opitutaceae bacterium]|jgi:tetratricopeptide (TPR) repeat protein